YGNPLAANRDAHRVLPIRRHFPGGGSIVARYRVDFHLVPIRGHDIGIVRGNAEEGEPNAALAGHRNRFTGRVQRAVRMAHEAMDGLNCPWPIEASTQM